MNNFYDPMRSQKECMQGYSQRVCCKPYAEKAENGCNVPLHNETEHCCKTHTVTDIFPENPSVAMAYVPFQVCGEVYECITALSRGTLFPALDKPFEGCR